MLMKHLVLLGTLASLFMLPVAQLRGASLSEEARFLAGLSVQDPDLQAFTRDRAWASHAAALDAAFNKQEQKQLSHVRAWSRENIPQTTETMYYMFSGPDFLYANAFFPIASTYILCGTEPVGNVPDLSKLSQEQLNNGLVGLRESMKTMLDFHYFITKDMRVDLMRTQISGTLPILLVFLARTGNSVQNITFVKSPANGVKITFGSIAGKQTLYYFNTNLANGNSGSFMQWCAAQGPGVSLLKAASYLMHSGEFSNVRDFLLKNSTTIVEDDSGIPLRDLQNGQFNLHFYGNFDGPIELFAKYPQPDLVAAFRGASPLDFGFGYHWQTAKGMLILATKR